MTRVIRPPVMSTTEGPLYWPVFTSSTRATRTATSARSPASGARAPDRHAPLTATATLTSHRTHCSRAIVLIRFLDWVATSLSSSGSRANGAGNESLRDRHRRHPDDEVQNANDPVQIPWKQALLRETERRDDGSPHEGERREPEHASLRHRDDRSEERRVGKECRR